jgi:hypothetical protein
MNTSNSILLLTASFLDRRSLDRRLDRILAAAGGPVAMVPVLPSGQMLSGFGGRTRTLRRLVTVTPVLASGPAMFPVLASGPVI